MPLDPGYAPTRPTSLPEVAHLALALPLPRKLCRCPYSHRPFRLQSRFQLQPPDPFIYQYVCDSATAHQGAPHRPETHPHATPTLFFVSSCLASSCTPLPHHARNGAPPRDAPTCDSDTAAAARSLLVARYTAFSRLFITWSLGVARGVGRTAPQGVMDAQRDFLRAGQRHYMLGRVEKPRRNNNTSRSRGSALWLGTGMCDLPHISALCVAPKSALVQGPVQDTVLSPRPPCVSACRGATHGLHMRQDPSIKTGACAGHVLGSG